MKIKSKLFNFFKGLNWKQHLSFIVVYVLCYGVCYYLTMMKPSIFSQSCLGMLDNGPLIYLGLLGLDPEGPVMKWFDGLSCHGKWTGWLKSPLYLAVFISAIVNTMTDGLGALGDPTSSFIGVVFGCLCVMIILPIVWVVRDVGAKADGRCENDCKNCQHRGDK